MESSNCHNPAFSRFTQVRKAIINLSIHKNKHCRRKLKIFPSTNQEHEKQKQRRILEESSFQFMIKTLLKIFMFLVLYPLTPIIFYIKIILTEDWSLIQTATELSFIFIILESSLQSTLSLWLIVRGIIRSPLDYDHVEVISWSRDKFGNPVPLPTLPLASLITSLISLMMASMRLQLRHTSWTQVTSQYLSIISRVVWVVFSVLLRVFSLTFLWIYFDSKTIILLTTVLIINFSLSYRLEFSSSKNVKNHTYQFSLWMTSFFNIFVPCWYTRNSSLCSSILQRNMSILTIPAIILISIWIILCFILVNFTDFRYNNNVLNNDDFIITSLSLLIFTVINTCISIMFIRPAWSCYSSRDLLSIITCFFSFIAASVLILHYSHIRESRSVVIVSQHYQDTRDNPRMFLKSYKAQMIYNSDQILVFTGEIVSCESVQNQSRVQDKIFVFDPTNPNCFFSSSWNISKVLILEDWDFRSSSPYPSSHKFLSLDSLTSSTRTIISLPKISSDEVRRFLSLKTFTSLLNGEHVASLAEYTEKHLTVDCGNYSSLGVNSSSSSVFLNNKSQPSMNVDLTLEELSYSGRGLYRISSYKTEKQHTNIQCSGRLSRDLDSLLCDVSDQFWHQEYLDNYRCCTEDDVSVLTSEKCRTSNIVSWSHWSNWSDCDQVLSVVSGGVERVMRRYRLSHHDHQCLSVMLDTRSCIDDINRGGCSLETVRDNIPSC